MSFRATSPPSVSIRPTVPRPPGQSSPLRPLSPPLPVSSTPRSRVHSHSTPHIPSQSAISIRRVSSGNVGSHAHADSNASSVSSTASSSPQPRSRARDLLRKHYGLGVGPPTPTGKPEDPMDLGKLKAKHIRASTHRVTDSPSFDAKTYYEQLITTSSLATLLRRENELLSGTVISG